VYIFSERARLRLEKNGNAKRSFKHAVLKASGAKQFPSFEPLFCVPFWRGKKEQKKTHELSIELHLKRLLRRFTPRNDGHIKLHLDTILHFVQNHSM
jgi:hypothetical protein